MKKLMQMSQESLVKRVQHYMQRANKGTDVPVYPLDQEGDYMIIGGADDWNRYDIPQVFRGKYLDVVAHAVRIPEFYSDWVSEKEPEQAGNCNCGYVVAYKAPEVIDVPKMGGLASMLKMMEKMQKTKVRGE